jgi:hypothetical protein
MKLLWQPVLVVVLVMVFLHTISSSLSDSSTTITTSTVNTPILVVDSIDKTPISNFPSFVQQADAFVCCFCQNCGTSEFSPGHEATSPGDAHNLAPRQEAQSSEGELTAKDVALGQEFKKGIK